MNLEAKHLFLKTIPIEPLVWVTVDPSKIENR